MAAPRPLRRLLPILLALCPLTLAAETTVSIEDVIPSEGHECVSSCIDYPNVVGEDVNDIGSALACGIPYENACWCATATASINSVSKHINSCASNRCSAGDLDRDISTMRAVYAGYCLDAGFTQPLVSDWYTTSEESSSDDKASSTAEPSGTTDPGPAQTTTQLTLVTETTDGTAGGSRGELFLLGAVVVPAVVLQLL